MCAFFNASRSGMNGSPEAVASPDDDVCDAEHGPYALWMSPGLGSMNVLEWSQVCVRVCVCSIFRLKTNEPVLLYHVFYVFPFH